MNNQRKIQQMAIARAILDKNKFNFPLHHHVENLTDEVSDREPSDIGMELKQNHE